MIKLDLNYYISFEKLTIKYDQHKYDKAIRAILEFN